MTSSEIRRAAIQESIVVARVRNSTEMMEIRGRICEITDAYQNGKWYPVVVVKDLEANGHYRVAPDDVLRVVETKKARAEEKFCRAEQPDDVYSYQNLGRVGPEEFRVMCYKNGMKAALYSGYMHETSEIMRLYIKEMYVAGMPTQDQIALRLLGRTGA